MEKVLKTIENKELRRYSPGKSLSRIGCLSPLSRQKFLDFPPLRHKWVRWIQYPFARLPVCPLSQPAAAYRFPVLFPGVHHVHFVYYVLPSDPLLLDIRCDVYSFDLPGVNGVLFGVVDVGFLVLDDHSHCLFQEKGVSL